MLGKGCTKVDDTEDAKGYVENLMAKLHKPRGTIDVGGIWDRDSNEAAPAGVIRR